MLYAIFENLIFLLIAALLAAVALMDVDVRLVFQVAVAWGLWPAAVAAQALGENTDRGIPGVG